MQNMETISKEINRDMQRNWGWLMALGVLFILMGLVGLGMMVGVTMASMIVIGALMMAGGVAQLIDAFQSKCWKGVLWHVLIGLLYLIAGGLVIYDPIMASAIITALLAWTLIIMGIARVIMAFSLHGESGWGWILLAGIADFALGVLILAHWPSSALWVIGMLISIEMMISGWTTVFLAMAMRGRQHKMA